jgi:hypothetical protein
VGLIFICTLPLGQTLCLHLSECIAQSPKPLEQLLAVLLLRARLLVILLVVVIVVVFVECNPRAVLADRSLVAVVVRLLCASE